MRGFISTDLITVVIVWIFNTTMYHPVISLIVSLFIYFLPSLYEFSFRFSLKTFICSFSSVIYGPVTKHVGCINFTWKNKTFWLGGFIP